MTRPGGTQTPCATINCSSQIEGQGQISPLLFDLQIYFTLTCKIRYRITSQKYYFKLSNKTWLSPTEQSQLLIDQLPLNYHLSFTRAISKHFRDVFTIRHYVNRYFVLPYFTFGHTTLLVKKSPLGHIPVSLNALTRGDPLQMMLIR